MRPDVLNPVSDRPRLEAAVALARDLYALHEAGRDYSSVLNQFAALVGKPVSRFDVDAAFGSIRPENFAGGLLADRAEIPQDLSEAEMLELVELICKADGTESQVSYWLKCLQVNTRNARVSDLFYWPGDYFGDGDNSRELTPQEILRTAMTDGRASG